MGDLVVDEEFLSENEVFSRDTVKDLAERCSLRYDDGLHSQLNFFADLYLLGRNTPTSFEKYKEELEGLQHLQKHTKRLQGALSEMSEGVGFMLGEHKDSVISELASLGSHLGEVTKEFKSSRRAWPRKSSDGSLKIYVSRLIQIYEANTGRSAGVSTDYKTRTTTGPFFRLVKFCLDKVLPVPKSDEAIRSLIRKGKKKAKVK